jgi:hypothetical protein
LGYVSGTFVAALILLAATLPLRLLVVEVFPRIHARALYAVAVWLLAVRGLTMHGAMAFMSLVNCPDQPECW